MVTLWALNTESGRDDVLLVEDSSSGGGVQFSTILVPAPAMLDRKTWLEDQCPTGCGVTGLMLRLPFDVESQLFSPEKNDLGVEMWINSV